MEQFVYGLKARVTEMNDDALSQLLAEVYNEFERRELQFDIKCAECGEKV